VLDVIFVGVASAYFNVIEKADADNTPAELTDFTLTVPPTKALLYFIHTNELSVFAEAKTDPVGNVHLYLATGACVEVGAGALAL